MEIEIPCILMRGGSSRGPYFRADDLPADTALRDSVLLSVMGSPHELQINGLGGGTTLTSKVAIVSRSSRPGCDVDYLFVQVSVDKALVDTRPNCGNMLSGVGPFAIESGLVPAHDGVTVIRIFNVNTGTLVEATVQTPAGHVLYTGNTRIDGVPGSGAPIALSFLDTVGGLTGSMFPTGSRTDVIDGTQVSCIDVAIPVMAVAASSLGIQGNERPRELDANTALKNRIEHLRLEAGRRMGLGDVSSSVVPKPVIVSAGDSPNAIQSRYFTPHHCHKSHAVTGAIAVASSFVIPGTVSNELSQGKLPLTGTISVMHPSGRIEVTLALQDDKGHLTLSKAGVVRTARKIMQGTVCAFVPSL